ncbi:enoyl-CoA hydratase/isomerase family protein [Luteimonas sp. BDR2-5]|uniref:enoyl-CoA hydratase/isomerase family protein n=1 Tax=Proluteimonas luteida TaxID=2878685 RepID=UPI001E65C0DD|nr:enoyl-CoA hydratase/isomerase family protein [Luteimonas sp. BDR2-5]MCD9029565.1 enoyl-CoA hydratase/isomerase family protein [Luteimonas sp. BDR2-5]
MSEPATESVVLFEERAAADGRRIGIATLNSPKTLNGLSLAMARLLDEKLVQWAADDGIAVVVLQGAGEKAFCAGGDLQSLYRSMVESRGPGPEAGGRGRVPLGNAYAAEFFEVEYRLDYRIHTYAKPLLCWGHGVVMGGGIGLMSGASHRVVSERSKLAFPEITVGLFPDVGGSWLLDRVPDRAGLFLAATGALLGPGDAIHAGLADVHLPEASRDDVFAALQAEGWDADAKANHARLGALLARFMAPVEVGPLQLHAQTVAAICAHERLEDIVEAIATLDAGDDAWLSAAQKTLAAGSPGSVRLGYELQRRAADLSLADVFRLEYIAALHCAAHGDFAEGIRALLIDKDRNPKWEPATLAAATPAWANTFLEAPAWPGGTHPLADLGS